MGVPRPSAILTRPWINQYVACSSSVERAFRPLVGQRLTTIQNGIDTERFVNTRAARTRAPSEIRFLAVGGMRPAKNYPRMVEAFVRARRKFDGSGMTAQLTIVGDGGDFGVVQQAIHARGAETYIHLAGHHEDITPFMQEADVFLSSSDREGLPIATLEAVAAGLPVIATPVPAMIDLAREGFPVSVASSFSDLDLSTAIVAASGDYLTRFSPTPAQIGEMLEPFSIETCAAAYRELYQRLLL
jgi:glycosyltransferase involved in cell wall biosynthesis